MSSSLQNLYNVIGKSVKIKKHGVAREVEGKLVDVGRLHLILAETRDEPIIPYKQIEWVKYYEETKLTPPFGAEDAAQR